MNAPKAKKQYGQNFLTNPMIPERIVKESGINGDFGVIEVGPGRGILTEELAKVAKKVVAVEIDRELVPLLKERFFDYDNVVILEGDILEADINGIINEYFTDIPIAVCANIPYYITSPIIMRFLEGEFPLESITVMVQKEVAQRLVSKEKSPDYSAMTVVCNYYSTVKRLFTVPAGCFTPKPKVDSSVIKFDIRKKPLVSPLDKKLFFSIIKTAFTYRRKTLANCLHSLQGNIFSKEEISSIITDCGFNENIRGEELSVLDFGRLADAFYSHIKN